ncbi:hypothetical protein TNCV_3373281 [Trichonephila clavipes]|nr:hypothetical protein TNCV_3373281 [Trichonephila clavipes]
MYSSGARQHKAIIPPRVFELSYGRHLVSGNIIAVTKTSYEVSYMVGNHMKPITGAEILGCDIRKHELENPAAFRLSLETLELFQKLAVRMPESLSTPEPPSQYKL